MLLALSREIGRWLSLDGVRALSVLLLSCLTGRSYAQTFILPVEVVGTNGTAVSRVFAVPAGTVVTQPLTCSMLVNNLKYLTEMSVQFNGRAVIPIGMNVAVQGQAANYGGIGGGFTTIPLTFPIPADTLIVGNNMATFIFNGTDGVTSGFRVIGFNVAGLIPATAFVEEDTEQWKPPMADAVNIAAGKLLWQTAPLMSNDTPTAVPIKAHCRDCHTVDGRDLKYFNYSNTSIEARSVFHGLNATQAAQIASYIRTLPAAHPGQPWNPPYQPGPGLDADHVNMWAAGAGYAAIEPTDASMLAAMFPNGIADATVYAYNGRLNQRQTPIAIQLPNWNDWLPQIAPEDAYSDFISNGYYTSYVKLLGELAPTSAAYLKAKPDFDAWFSSFYGYYQTKLPTTWTPVATQQVYSLAQWGIVKTWELNKQFSLEGFNREINGTQADVRGWYSNLPFFTAPHEMKMIPSGTPGLRQGSGVVYAYLSFAWYYLQLILNDTNSNNYQFPIDYPYMLGFIQNLGMFSTPQAGPMTEWLVKEIQSMHQSPNGLQAGSSIAEPWLLTTREWNIGVFGGVDSATRAAIATGVTQAWLNEVSSYTPAQWYARGFFTAATVPVAGGNPYLNVLPDATWYMIPRLKFLGVNPALMEKVASWAATIWPAGNWQADLAATCSWANTYPDSQGVQVNASITCSK